MYERNQTNIKCLKFLCRLKYIQTVKMLCPISLAHQLVKWNNLIIHYVNVFQSSYTQLIFEYNHMLNYLLLIITVTVH